MNANFEKNTPSWEAQQSMKLDVRILNVSLDRIQEELGVTREAARRIYGERLRESFPNTFRILNPNKESE